MDKDLKHKLIAMIEGVQDDSIIEYLYTFIRLFLEKWSNQRS